MSRQPRRYDPWIAAGWLFIGLICGALLIAAYKAAKP